MRTDSPGFTFDAFNASSTKRIRLVLKIDFPTPLYLASHDDIPNIPVGTLGDTIKNVSSTSQRIMPDMGRSEIGSIKLDVVDVAGGVSSRFNTEEAAGNGLTGRKVELYRGGEGMDWSDFRLEQTQQISQSVQYENGGYNIQCADIQRAARKDIFDLAKTTLSADFLKGASTINVFDTSDFEACTHVASFGDQPTGSFFYFRIKYENGFEICRATGKTATSFTGVTRGIFGTADVDHIFPTGEDADSSVEIEEYVYLELPAPAMAHALYTGQLPGGGTIPTRWNLGIPTASVNEDSFENIGEDWFDSSDYTKGLIFRFQGVTKTDGKRFIEREVLLLAGAFVTVGADGALYLKRMTGVISSSDYVQELTPRNVVKAGPLKHDLSRVRNTFDIEWSWVHFPGEDKPRYVRRNILVDATSQGIHGESKTYSLKFRGLHNERHTYTTLINRFDALRDRFAGPPLTITLELLPTENNLEVGDICRVFLPNVKDFTTGGHLDRSMEIQRITLDQKTGKLRAQMFGSSLKAEPIADSGAGTNSELPDGWYTSAGTDFATAGLSIDGSGILQSNGTLTGGTTTRTIYYYLGDFTIPSGLTLTCSGNVELRIRGTLQINGTLRGGTGMPATQSGFIGTTNGGRVRFEGRNPPYFEDFRGAPFYVVGRYNAMPVLEIENNSGVLAGIPADMRGTGGGQGRPFMFWNSGDVVWEQLAAGGAGGGGGGSIVTVSRGAGYGVSGETNLDGSDGTAGSVSTLPPYSGANAVAGGSGGGGAPGCLVHLLDGSGVNFPIIAGNVSAEYGISPIPSNGDEGACGKINPSAAPLDLGIACARAQYVPKSRDPYPDYNNDNLGSQDGYSTYTATVYQRSASAPSTPTVDDGEYNFDTETLTPPTGWSTTPPAGADPLYVSTGQFRIQGITGTDSTVTWTTPALLVSDGADGADGADGNSVYYASIFIRSASAPSLPTGGQYDFTNKQLTPPAGGWSDTPPASDGNALYVSTAIAEINGTTGVDTTLTWSTPAELTSDGADGAAGADGADGLSVHVANVYRRSSSAPIAPTGGEYNFGTNALTPPSLWFAEPPAGADPLYVSTSSFSVQGTTGIDNTPSWSTPSLLVQDGADGADGAPGADGADAINSRYPTIYRLNSNAINSTSGSFADPLAGNTSWSYSVPTMTTDGDVVYASSRIFTSDGLAPQEANWSTPAVYAQRTDGVDGTNGSPGADGQGIRTVNAYRKNNSAYSTTAGSFADPLNGQTGWTFDVPAITADGDIVYVITRTFTDDAAAPQDAAWSAPAIYAQRTDGIQGVPGNDGADGADAVDTRYPTIYRLNSNSITSTAGTFADPLSGNTSWSYSVPALAADGDIVYAASRIFTADGNPPQQANWSTPAIYAQRTDGADGATGGTGPAGDDGQAVRQANLYRLNSNAYNTTAGTFADPSSGQAGWSFDVPALAADGDIVYVITRTFTDDGLAPQDAVWSTPAVYASRNDGADGADGATGADGADGTSVHVSVIYRRSYTDPGTPTGGQYVFGASPVLTPPTNWSESIPADDGRPLWSSTGVWSVTGPTGTDTSTTWSAPVEVAANNRVAVLDSVDWAISDPQTFPMGQWSQYNGVLSNMATVNDEQGPFDDYPIIGQIRGANNNPGWFGGYSGKFAKDFNKSYIFYGWVKRVGGTSSGLYIGPQNTVGGGDVQSMAGVANTNAYTISNQGGVMTDGKWYLVVMVIWGKNAVTVDQGLAGLYDPVTGERIYDGAEWRWLDETSETARVRWAFYDNAAPTIPPTQGFDFTRITGWEMNGSEPTLQQVLSGGVGLSKAPIVAAVKANYSSFTTTNSGEMYIHGLDRNGDAIDADGSMIIDGARVTLPKGYVYTNETVGQGFIVIETGAGTPFSGSSADSKKAGCQVVVTDGVVQWQYDNNSVWTNFTPTDTMFIIGLYSSTVGDTIAAASIIPPQPISSGVINAARIEANSLRAITATVGNLETRASGGSPTTPRLILQDNVSPLKIFDTDDLTELFSLTNTANGLRINILGDFVANSLDTANAFSAAGITDLRGRLGLSEPSAGTGGSLSVSGTPTLYSGTINVWKYINVDVLGGGGANTWIDSGGNDITLYLKVRANDWGLGLPGSGDSTWEVKWQYRVDSGGGFGAWTDVDATLNNARWNFTGDMQISSGPGEPTEWFYSLNEERTYVWTGALANNDYEFRVAARETQGGYTGGGDDLAVATANEPISGGGVIEAHTHDITEIDEFATEGITGVQSAGVTGSAHDLVRLDANAYLRAGWINTVSGATTSDPVRIYASQDSYIRYMTPANFIDFLEDEQWDFGTQSQHRYGIGGDYSTHGGTTAFGATIWSIDSGWQGAASGTDSAPTNVYGIRWHRAAHANAHADIGEGLYVYQAGTLYAGMGSAGLYTSADCVAGAFKNGALTISGNTIDCISGTYVNVKGNLDSAGGTRLYDNTGNVRGYHYYNATHSGLLHSGGGWALQIAHGSTQVTIPGNLDVNNGLDVTGNITVTGTVDGVDVAKTVRYVTAGYDSGDITVSGTAPGTPAQGDIWFDTAASVAANSISTASGYTLAQSTATYGGLNVGGTAKGGYYGIQLASELTFMWSGSVGGIYNHDGSDWVVQHNRLAEVSLWYAGSKKFETLSSGARLTGSLQITDSSTVIGEGSGNSIRHTTNSGYIDVGAQNTTYGHINTDRGAFYMNKRLDLAAGARYYQKGGLPYYDSATYTGGKITVSTTAPTSPATGDIWFDTS